MRLRSRHQPPRFRLPSAFASPSLLFLCARLASKSRGEGAARVRGGRGYGCETSEGEGEGSVHF